MMNGIVLGKYFLVRILILVGVYDFFGYGFISYKFLSFVFGGYL